MRGYFITDDSDQNPYNWTIKSVDAPEAEIYDMTRKNVWRVVDGSPQMVPNEGFIASQVFWTEDALRSHLDSFSAPGVTQ